MMNDFIVCSATRAYRLLLYTYPPEFRREFGAEMAQVFTDRCRAVASSKGLFGLVGFGMDITADWIVSTMREGFASMSYSVQPAGAAPRPADGVPVFYIGADEAPRAASLIHGGLLSTLIFAFICFLIGHGGNRRFWLMGSHHPSRSHLLPVTTAAEPDSDLAAEVKVNPYPEEPPLLPYYRAILVLAELDVNHDGVISAAEIADAPRVLRLLDRNLDGVLDAGECGQKLIDSDQFDSDFVKRAKLGFMRVHPVLAALDSDHDGVISRPELNASAAALRTLDQDNDGRLTIDEVLPDPIAAQVARIFVPADRNGDGRISADERSAVGSSWIRQILNDADGNHDGVVTEDELAAELQAHGTSTSARKAARR